MTETSFMDIQWTPLNCITLYCIIVCIKYNKFNALPADDHFCDSKFFRPLPAATLNNRTITLRFISIDSASMLESSIHLKC